MMKYAHLGLLVVIALGAILLARPSVRGVAPTPGSLRDPREEHLASLRQLTFSGQNAEAYFSFDGSKLIFQSTQPPFACDQIFTMRIDGSDVKLLSTGKGRTTCSFFFPDGQTFIYASTHLGEAPRPPGPDPSRGYVRALDPTYDIFKANLDGTAL